MQRLLASLLFCAAATFASAQGRDVTVTDNDMMLANAEKHTAMVDQAVTLTAEQRTKVQAVYMNVERQVNAMNQRFEMAGLSEQERQDEMRPHWVTMEKNTNKQLAEILTNDQMNKWQEVSK